MRNMFKAVSPVIATLLIILIVVASSVIVYLWVSGYAGSLTTASTEQTLREAIKIEAIKTIETDEGTLIILWVRNIGDTTVKVNAGYYGTTQGYKQANLAYISSSPPIWGGDVWTFSRETQTIEKTQNGLIFYEDFRDGYDENAWAIISTLEAGEDHGTIYIDEKYGLVLELQRNPLGDLVEKYGIRLNEPLSITDNVFIVEYETRKISGKEENYMVEVYFSPYVTNNNPYVDLDDWILTYIKGWYPPVVQSDAWIEKRGWYGTLIARLQSYGRWLLIFNRNENRIYVYYNETHNDNWYFIITNPAFYTNPYVYFDIGVWRNYEGPYNVSIPFIKIYRDLNFVVTNLGTNWEVIVLDERGNIISSEIVTSGNSIAFNRLDDNLLFPLEAHIVVIPTVDDASEIGYVIRPGEVKSVALFITEPLPESFSVKVVTENGVEAVFNIKR